MTSELRWFSLQNQSSRPCTLCTGFRKLAPNGEPVAATRTEIDKLGRAARIGKVAYLRAKEAGPVQWMTRFEYQNEAGGVVHDARVRLFA